MSSGLEIELVSDLRYKNSSVQIFSCIVVSVHFTTKCCRSGDSMEHLVFCLVVRDVQLEEASVSLREGVLVHVTNQPNLVLVAQVGQVDRQTASTPHKLEVCSALLVIHSLEGAPELGDDTMVAAVVGESGDRLQALNVDGLLTSAARLECLPVKEVKDLSLVLNDFEEAFSDCFDLLSCLVASSFQNQLNKLVDVCLGHLLILSVWADRDFFARG